MDGSDGFSEVDSRYRNRIVQGQAQGAHPINEQKFLPIALAALAQFHQAFDGGIVQAGDDLGHNPQSLLQRASAPLGSTRVPSLCRIPISMLISRPPPCPSISARRHSSTRGVTPGVWALNRTNSGSGLRTWRQRSSRAGKSRSNFHTSPLLPRPNEGGSSTRASYLCPRRTSRVRNLLTSSTTQWMGAAASPQSCALSRAQATMPSAASRWTTLAPAMAAANDMPPV